jgi:hypothetical protein
VTAFRTNASPIPEPVPVLLRALSVRYRAVEDIKQLAETFVIDSGTVARKLYSRPVLLARDADDAVADIFIAVFSAVVEKICHYPEQQFLSIHLEQHKNRPINHRSNFL